MGAQTTFAERWGVVKGIKSDLAEALEDEEEAVADYDEQLEEAGEGKLREDLQEIRDDEKDHARRLRRHLKRHVAGKSFADRWAVNKSDLADALDNEEEAVADQRDLAKAVVPGSRRILGKPPQYSGSFPNPKLGVAREIDQHLLHETSYGKPRGRKYQAVHVYGSFSPDHSARAFAAKTGGTLVKLRIVHVKEPGGKVHRHIFSNIFESRSFAEKWGVRKSFSELWGVTKSHVKGHYRQRGSKRSWVKPHERKETPGASLDQITPESQNPYRSARERERETSELFRDADVISTYTRKDALADGTLVDLTKWATPGGPEGVLPGTPGFKVPVAVTSAVWGEINDIPKSKQGIQDVRGRAHDVLTMAVLAARTAKPGNSEVLFRVIMDISATRGRYLTYKLNIGPGDVGEPVVTIMRPEED